MGVSSQRHDPAALYPRKGPPVPIVQEAGWAPEPVWTHRLEEKSPTSIGDRTPIVQPVVTILTEIPRLLDNWQTFMNNHRIENIQVRMASIRTEI
jgi:hypothetical protein